MNDAYPIRVRLSQFLSFLGLVRGSSRTWPVRAETAAWPGAG